ncbi:hypothetical protein BDA99DRAFT_432821 [Phascolomyces articulosus]|uniref:Methyltransferase type 11 domain-containing protein n=1 Tax=Phascolomyces articulosus TaxID=60185 RepID=A0AAD5KJI0_9FUNG|nr:hypothetical protein BDA99DRAFT_432821 [Phascolomyces articulosus]
MNLRLFFRSNSSNASSSDTEEEGFVEPKFPISQYEYIEGRNFRHSTDGDTPFLPCDDEENERLQLNYLLFKIGPGFWVKEMAEAFPNSHFTGTDQIIYPISDTPANYEWEKVVKELIRVTKPGGWIQLVETSGILQDVGPNMSIWLMRVTVSLQTRNIQLKFGPKLHELLEGKDGVTDLEYSHRSIPLGWLGKLGDLGLECMERMFDSMKPRLCDDWSMNQQKYEKMVEAAAKECHEFKSWTNIHYAFCRKKFPHEE